MNHDEIADIARRLNSEILQPLKDAFVGKDEIILLSAGWFRGHRTERQRSRLSKRQLVETMLHLFNSNEFRRSGRYLLSWHRWIFHSNIHRETCDILRLM